MTDLQKYVQAFTETFEIEDSVVDSLEYQSIPTWDSVGHMALMAAIEDSFNIMMEMDDIIEFSSFNKGKEILAKYDVIIE